MINNSKFTKKSADIIEGAVVYASDMGHTYVGSEHLLLSILGEDTSDAADILKNGGITFETFRNSIIELVGQGTPSVLNQRFFTAATKRILEKACSDAASSDSKQASAEHILTAIIKESTCTACTLIRKNGGDLGYICDKLCLMSDKKTSFELKDALKPRPSKYPNLFRYGRNMTDITEVRKNDPLIGRKNEVSRILQILARRSKNNPCLIGEAGVGKTAVIEGVAELFMRNAVPVSLKNKYIFSLDLTSLLSGAKYRGDFEERVKACVDEAVSARNIILFIDEIHSIVGAGAAEGAIDAANIMKPQLARGELQIIGATTFDEYRKSIEKDHALERRFQPVNISEPDTESCINIINGLKINYEKYHGVRITEKIVSLAVKMSQRYITDRFLPDKAIDILDEACAAAKIRAGETAPDIETDYISMNDRKLSELKSTVSISGITELTENDVYSVISMHSGVPVNRITYAEAKRLSSLSDKLSERIIGHRKAISKITEAVFRARSGLRDSSRPMASFLFAGATGVGKTELAKALADSIFDGERDLIRIDMSEYMEKHSVSKLIGAPPGYAGYDSNDHNLCEKVRRKPYSLVLFDEIEKADREVLNILLQILEDGIVTDSVMRQVSFRNCMIIMTSNVGAEEILTSKSLGFESNSVNDREEMTLSAIRKSFSPEFLNRIDEVIVFGPLEYDELLEISRKELEKLRLRAQTVGITLDFTDKVSEIVVDTKEAARYGARPIRRRVSELVESKLARMMINSEISRGDRIKIDIKDNEISVTKLVTV